MKCPQCPLKNSSVPCIVEFTKHTRSCELVKEHPGGANSILQSSMDLHNKIHNPEKIPMPNIGQKVLNFVEAMGRSALTGFAEVTEDVFQYRISICEGCAFLKEKVCTHPQCGCPVERKARLTSEKCPLGIWGPEQKTLAEGNIYQGKIEAGRDQSQDKVPTTEALVTYTTLPCGGCGQK